MKSSDKYALVGVAFGTPVFILLWWAGMNFWFALVIGAAIAGWIFEEILKFMVKIRIVDAPALKDDQ